MWHQVLATLRSSARREDQMTAYLEKPPLKLIIYWKKSLAKNVLRVFFNGLSVFKMTKKILKMIHARVALPRQKWMTNLVSTRGIRQSARIDKESVANWHFECHWLLVRLIGNDNNMWQKNGSSTILNTGRLSFGILMIQKRCIWKVICMKWKWNVLQISVVILLATPRILFHSSQPIVLHFLLPGLQELLYILTIMGKSQQRCLLVEKPFRIWFSILICVDIH